MERNDLLPVLVLVGLSGMYLFIAGTLKWRDRGRITRVEHDNAATREVHWYGDLYDS
jgi:hypothetical protein